tara:strand:- start:3347 stop:3748 length:402 start_codon:yes stop_codon:yes gene_type:complete
MNGIVKSVVRTGDFQEMGRFEVEFNHTQGEKIVFFAKSNIGDEIFPYEVGKDVNYSIKPNGNGQLIREDNFTKPSGSFSGGATGGSKDRLIVRQTCIKASSEFNATRNNASIDTVLEDAQTMFNFIFEENNGA